MTCPMCDPAAPLSSTHRMGIWAPGELCEPCWRELRRVFASGEADRHNMAEIMEMARANRLKVAA